MGKAPLASKKLTAAANPEKAIGVKKGVKKSIDKAGLKKKKEERVEAAVVAAAAAEGKAPPAKLAGKRASKAAIIAAARAAMKGGKDAAGSRDAAATSAAAAAAAEAAARRQLLLGPRPKMTTPLLELQLCSCGIVATMHAQNQGQRPGLEWQVEDATELSFPGGTFGAVLDVGVLDAVIAGTKQDMAPTMLTEVHRVLAPGGTYISVSTEPPVFRQPLLAAHPERGWSTDILRIPRPRDLDARIAGMDSVMSGADVGKLSVYVSKVVDARPVPDAAAEPAAAEAAERAGAGGSPPEQEAASTSA